MPGLPPISDLTENFSLFDDWEERYRYLIELGRELEPMDPALKTETTKVAGCTSQVWLFAVREGERFHFIVDSDAHIVRGLIAVLLSAYQDKTAQEIMTVDIDADFARLGLAEHLSPNRRNGFFAMAGRVRQLAQQALAAS